MPHNVLIAGAGKIGTLIACLLAESGRYQVHLADVHFGGDDITRLQQKFPTLHCETLDVTDKSSFSTVIQNGKIQTVISCLPYYCNEEVARVAREFNLNYFDLTEDIKVTEVVKGLAQDAQSVFVPQCGLAPGFITIVANDLMKKFDEIDEVKMRVGALPENTSNGLHYALTWSTDGLINEYGNFCHAIENGKAVELHPLEGLETIQLNGQLYEAFNTSGGLGSLPQVYHGKVKRMNYKTIRYPGHCEKMKFLMFDLHLNDYRDTLKQIFENTIPKTYKDVVLIYVSVSGMIDGVYLEDNYVNKVYPCEIAGLSWSAIQITTAAGVCGVMDMLVSAPNKGKGLIHQEKLSLDDFLSNQFGKYYRQDLR